MMPKLPPNYKPMFSDNQKFRSFAVQNHFPPVMQEREMMAQMNFNGRFKTPQNNPFVQQQQRQQQGGLQCMECSGQSYEHCYANARLRECPQQETACFMEVRYQGQTVVSVQSGCSQEVACINNMKQNFYSLAGKLLGVPPGSHTLESLSLGNTDQVDHFVLCKHV